MRRNFVEQQNRRLRRAGRGQRRARQASNGSATPSARPSNRPAPRGPSRDGARRSPSNAARRSSARSRHRSTARPRQRRRELDLRHRRPPYRPSNASTVPDNAMSARGNAEARCSSIARASRANPASRDAQTRHRVLRHRPLQRLEPRRSARPSAKRPAARASRFRKRPNAAHAPDRSSRSTGPRNRRRSDTPSMNKPIHRRRQPNQTNPLRQLRGVGDSATPSTRTARLVTASSSSPPGI